MPEYYGTPVEGRFPEESINDYRRRMGLPPLDQTKLERDGMVDKWYEMNPETEDLLFDGTEIEEGMVVLIEPASMKIDVREELTDEELYQAHRRNRWCLVGKLSYIGTDVIFQAEYEDGTKAKIVMAVGYSWLVKRGRQTMNVFEVPEKYFVDPGFVTTATAQVPGQIGFDEAHDGGEPTTDAAVQDYLIEEREGRPNLKVVGKTLFEQTEERWQQEKGKTFPRSPFSSAQGTPSDLDQPQEESR